MVNLIRRATALLAACAIVISVPSSPRAAQAVTAIEKSITYILPMYGGFSTEPLSEVQNQLSQLHSRLGPEGRRVKLGFTVYINVTMSPVDPTDTAAVRAALVPTFNQMDAAIDRAVSLNVPICLSFVTPVRGSVDALEDAAQDEDRRNAQWHSDPNQTLANGWMTLSRYARKHERIREAFIREVGRRLAARMLAHPTIIVAASGDGEIELSYERSLYATQEADRLDPAELADFSPFAVAEFRDWLRGTGMYAAGQPFAGEAYRNSARYNADASLGTLNADFFQNFDTWALRIEDWSLSDSETAGAIPASTYRQPGWQPTVSNTNGFAPPRPFIRGQAWSDAWEEFRQTMVWRYNLNFAKWITTSPDPATGATVPADRWFTDQIVADYLFGHVAPVYDLRLDTSASPHWTADIRPYGSLGITAFNQFNPATGTHHRTLAAVAPAIAQRNVRWGIFEWNPSLPQDTDPAITIYRQEMALVEQYKPSVLVPFAWQNPDFPLEGTGFETALKELVARLNVVPLALSRTSLVAATTANGAYRTPPQLVRVGGVAGETPPWSFASVSPLFDVAVTADGRGFTVAPKAQSYALQQQTGTVVVSSTDPGYSPATLTVTLNVSPTNGSAPPFGSFDTPTEGATVSGEVGVTGWAIDDIGIVGIDIFRTSVAGEAPNTFVYLGAATMVPGARPDVQAAYAVRPLAEQAGWGYMLLTNMLPNQGNGIFVLHAIARDVDGHSVVLGSRVINSQNSGSVLPFGTIDTPGQGETVSGTIHNFGWALSPNLIPEDGSTIAVYIDNAFVGRPTYNQVRSDIETLFPGYPNTTGGRGAVGFFQIDTTQYANGVHTIAWVVTDSNGQARGIGSRYFTIANP